MSIFSKLRAAKRAADEAKGAQKESKNQTQPAPYKHVPTHAAVDALSGAPSAWKAQDVPLIKAQHQRRSQLVRAGSIVVARELHTYSGSSWNDRGDRRMHPGGSSDTGVSSLGKSIVVSNEGTPSSGSGYSTPSQSSQVLELRPPAHTFRSQDLLASLHKSTQRKLGEAPILDAPPKRPASQPVPSPKSAKKWQFNGKMRASET